MSWKTVFSHLPVDYGVVIGEIEDMTQKLVFRMYAGGDCIKVVFSNRHSRFPLILDKAIIGIKEGDTVTNVSVVTRHGREKIVMAPGEEFESDEIRMEVQAFRELVLSFYVRERTKIGSACANWSGGAFYTRYQTGAMYHSSSLEGMESREVFPYADADMNKPQMAFGISGIRLLRNATFVPEMPGCGRCFGEAGIKRFEQDVFGEELPDEVWVLEGVNDLMHPGFFGHPEEVAEAWELQEGFRELIRISQEKNCRIYLGTIMPFVSTGEPWQYEAEKIRRQVNEWIVSQTFSDGIMDFAAAVEQKGRIECMRDGLHIGDGLHPNAAGGAVMAEVPVDAAKA